jgi:hypothetical protein
MKRHARTGVLLPVLALLLGACQSNLARQNPLSPSPSYALPSGPGVFETFENGPELNDWHGAGSASESIVPTVVSSQYYSGQHSLQYVISVNATSPGSYGSAGQDLDSHFGIVNASGDSQLTLEILTNAAFTLSSYLAQDGTGGLSCFDTPVAGMAPAWALPSVNVPASPTWQKISISIAAPSAHVRGSCTAGAFNPAAIQSLELDFAPTAPATILNATIFVDDIVFEP